MGTRIRRARWLAPVLWLSARIMAGGGGGGAAWADDRAHADLPAAHGAARDTELGPQVDSRPALPAAAPPYMAAPRPVSALEVVPFDLRYHSDLVRLVVVKPGEVPSRKAVRQSIDNLLATGRFHDVRVLRVETAAGVVLRFELVPAFRVGRVDFKGSLGIGKGALRKASGLAPGRRLAGHAVDDSVERVRLALNEAGYREAAVTVSRRPDVTGETLDLVFTVEAGPPTVVERVQYRIEGRVSEAAVSRIVRVRPGKPLDKRGLRRDMERAREFLKSRGLPMVSTGFEDVPGRNPLQAVVFIDVKAGPRIDIRSTGDKLDEKLSERVRSLIEGRVAGPALAADIQTEIREELQGRGYLGASVDAEWRPGGGGSGALVLAVRKGRKFIVKDIAFDGSRQIKTGKLKDLIQTRERSIPSYFMSFLSMGYMKPGTYNPQALEGDRKLLLDEYQKEGFTQAEVSPPSVATDAIKGSVEIKFGVNEGLRHRILDVRIEGNLAIPAELLVRTADLHIGTPFNPGLLSKAADRILAEYSSRGFARARVDPRTVSQDGGVTCIFTVQEGSALEVDRVVVRGNHRTRPNVILDHLGVSPGDPVDPVKLFARERMLYRLGLFSRIDVKAVASSPFAGVRNVLVDVEENKPWSVTYGAGFDSEELLRGQFELSHENLWGTGRSAGLFTRVGKQETRLRLWYRDPRFLDRDVLALVSAFSSQTDEGTFDARRDGTAFQLRRTFTPRTLGTALYEFRNVRNSNLKVSPELLDPEDQEVRLGSITFSLTRDTRDNPIDPRRGTLLGSDVELASPIFGSSTRFLKGSARAFSFRDLGHSVVFAAAARAGLATSFESREELPISERFFAGGSTTIRSLPRNELGPLDPTFGTPLGGNARFLLNAELRIPIVGPFGLALFTDAGNVFGRVSQIDLKSFEVASGAGIRIRTPIGPVRFDYGWSLVERRSEYFISIGNPF